MATNSRPAIANNKVWKYYETLHSETWPNSAGWNTHHESKHKEFDIKKAQEIYLKHADRFRPWLMAEYLREIWILAADAGQMPDSLRLIDCFEGRNASTLWPMLLCEKARRLYQALKFLMDIPAVQICCLDMVQQVHAMLNNLDGPVRFRTYDRTDGFLYAPHETIQERLTILLSFTQWKMGACQLCWSAWYSLMAIFYSEFIRISPFESNNEATARLLVTMFLKSEAVVPFSWFPQWQREPLESMIRQDPYHPPNKLAYYLLSAAHQTAQQIAWGCLTFVD